jgi:aarF domain-containing kinase
MQRLHFKHDYWRNLYHLHSSSKIPPNRALPQFILINQRWNSKTSRHQHWRPNPWLVYPTALLLFSGAGLIAYWNYQPFRYVVLASVRCSRVAGRYFFSSVSIAHFMLCNRVGAAILGAVDYKRTFAHDYRSDDERLSAYSECHKRSAKRVLKALSFCVYFPWLVTRFHVGRCLHQDGSTYGFIVSS